MLSLGKASDMDQALRRLHTLARNAAEPQNDRFAAADVDHGGLQADGCRAPVKDDGDAKPTQMKIDVMERVASLLLATRGFVVRNYPPFDIPVSAPFAEHVPELAALDRLKIAYAQGGDARLLRQYVERRDRLAALAFPRAPA